MTDSAAVSFQPTGSFWLTFSGLARSIDKSTGMVITNVSRIHENGCPFLIVSAVCRHGIQMTVRSLEIKTSRADNAYFIAMKLQESCDNICLDERVVQLLKILREKFSDAGWSNIFLNDRQPYLEVLRLDGICKYGAPHAHIITLGGIKTTYSLTVLAGQVVKDMEDVCASFHGIGEHSIPVIADLSKLFPSLRSMVMHCPYDGSLACGSCPHIYPMALSHIIVHLNDSHKWSRERIADWLETLPVDLTLKAVSKGD